MIKAADIYNFIDEAAPFSTALPFDNTGILVGSADAPVSKIGVCLDITSEAVRYAEQNGIDLIVCHHPVIFNPLKRVKSGSAVYELVRCGITAVAAHTNLDAAEGGVCESVCARLGIRDIEPVFDDEFKGYPPIARIGTVSGEYTVDSFAEYVAERLGAPDIRLCGDGAVRRVAVANGAGSSLIPVAYGMGADTIITSEVKHHEWIFAREVGINVLDAGHYFTENEIVSVLADRLGAQFGIPVCVIPTDLPYRVIKKG